MGQDVGSRSPGAVVAAQAAIGVAEAAGARIVLPGAYFTIGWVSAVSGRLDEADANIKQAMTASLDVNDVVHRSSLLTAAGLMRNWTGEFDAAARLQADALALARQHDLLVPLLFGFFLYGLTLIGKGDYDAALESLTDGLTLAERLGDEAIHHRLLNCLGWLYAELGDLELATDPEPPQLGDRAEAKRPGTFPNATINMGEIFLARGELGLAQEQLESVLRYSREPTTSEWMRFRYSIRLFLDLGEVALARGETTLAREHATRGLDLATRTGSRKNLLKAWRLTGGDRDAGAPSGRRPRPPCVRPSDLPRRSPTRPSSGRRTPRSRASTRRADKPTLPGTPGRGRAPWWIASAPPSCIPIFGEACGIPSSKHDAPRSRLPHR